jgi:PTS system mannose-specific IID component
MEQHGDVRKRLAGTYLRSLFIQSTWNFWRMQNLGFVFAMIPTIRFLSGDGEAKSRMLVRHLQPFNTHPCMSGPIIGSVMRLEEDLYRDGRCEEADRLKTALMAPYAAIGDSLFWGSLKPLAGIVGVLLALKGFLLAGLALLLVYNPLHMWVRLKGFLEGYRKGREGVDFIRDMNLPRLNRMIRWMSVVVLGVLAWVVSGLSSVPVTDYGVLSKGVVPAVVLICFWLIQRGVPVLGILYGASLMILIAGR